MTYSPARRFATLYESVCSEFVDCRDGRHYHEEHGFVSDDERGKLVEDIVNESLDEARADERWVMHQGVKKLVLTREEWKRSHRDRKGTPTVKGKKMRAVLYNAGGRGTVLQPVYIEGLDKGGEPVDEAVKRGESAKVGSAVELRSGGDGTVTKVQGDKLTVRMNAPGGGPPTKRLKVTDRADVIRVYESVDEAAKLDRAMVRREAEELGLDARSINIATQAAIQRTMNEWPFPSQRAAFSFAESVIVGTEPSIKSSRKLTSALASYVVGKVAEVRPSASESAIDEGTRYPGIERYSKHGAGAASAWMWVLKLQGNERAYAKGVLDAHLNATKKPRPKGISPKRAKEIDRELADFDIGESLEEKADALDEAVQPIPGDPRNWNASQRKAAIDKLAKWPLAKLRKHQALNTAQTKKAYAKRDTAALEDLQAMADIYTAAVMKREFGESVDEAKKYSRPGANLGGVGRPQSRPDKIPASRFLVQLEGRNKDIFYPVGTESIAMDFARAAAASGKYASVNVEGKGRPMDRPHLWQWIKGQGSTVGPSGLKFIGNYTFDESELDEAEDILGESDDTLDEVDPITAIGALGSIAVGTGVGVGVVRAIRNIQKLLRAGKKTAAEQAYDKLSKKDADAVKALIDRETRKLNASVDEGSKVWHAWPKARPSGKSAVIRVCHRQSPCIAGFSMTATASPRAMDGRAVCSLNAGPMRCWRFQIAPRSTRRTAA